MLREGRAETRVPAAVLRRHDGVVQARPLHLPERPLSQEAGKIVRDTQMQYNPRAAPRGPTRGPPTDATMHPPVVASARAISEPSWRRLGASLGPSYGRYRSQ